MMMTGVKQAPPEAELLAEARQPDGTRVLQMLLDKVERGEFTSGQPIKESVLAQHGNWSRNAVREALSQLVGWDILEYTPYCGYRVREYTLQDLLDMYELREAIEPLAARRIARLRPQRALNELAAHLNVLEAVSEHRDQAAFRRADLDFHLSIVANCGNRQFAQKQMQVKLIALFYLNRIHFSEAMYRQYSTLRYFDHQPTHEEFDALNTRLTVEMHRNIFDSLCRGEAETAERLCREHAAGQVKNIENFILYYPELTQGDLSGLDRFFGEKKASSPNRNPRRRRSCPDQAAAPTAPPENPVNQ